MASVELQNLSHAFGRGEMRRQVLQEISLTIDPGEVVLLTGPSGCGKTTLLTLIGALRTVQSGEVTVLGHRLDGAGRRQRQQVRRGIGMIFQGHNLLRCLTAEQNVQMGADLLPGLGYRARRDEARHWLRSVGLEDQMGKLPHDLSGGQKQRVAIARALAAHPRLLLADEPTGNLDSGTSEKVITTLFEATGAAGAALVLVTHDPVLAERCSRVLTIEDGRIVEDRASAHRAA